MIANIIYKKTIINKILYEKRPSTSALIVRHTPWPNVNKPRCEWVCIAISSCFFNFNRVNNPYFLKISR